MIEKSNIVDSKFIERLRSLMGDWRETIYEGSFAEAADDLQSILEEFEKKKE